MPEGADASRDPSSPVRFAQKAVKSKRYIGGDDYGLVEICCRLATGFQRIELLYAMLSYKVIITARINKNKGELRSSNASVAFSR